MQNEFNQSRNYEGQISTLLSQEQTLNDQISAIEGQKQIIQSQAELNPQDAENLNVQIDAMDEALISMREQLQSVTDERTSLQATAEQAVTDLQQYFDEANIDDFNLTGAAEGLQTEISDMQS